MEPGLDILGIAHPKFPFKRILNEVPTSTPIGMFWNVFGKTAPRFQTLLDHQYKTFRLQMWWGGNNHATVPIETLKLRLKEVKTALKGRSDITLYISPACEHAERNVYEVKTRLEIVRGVIPFAIPVNNPWRGHGAEVPGYPHEYHGSSPGRCDLASTDGTNIYDINAEEWVKTYCNREHPAFLWGSRFNLREISDPGQAPPPIKDRKAVPSLGYLRSILRLRHPKGEVPNVPFSYKPFRAPNIYKTHAEDDQEPNENTPDEPRENRPVLISEFNVDTIDILAANGSVIGHLKRFGSYPGGLYRHYAGIPGGVGLYGYEIGNKAKARANSEFIWLRGKGKTVGPVHPAFRSGSFRTTALYEVGEK